ncbi:MAG: pantetheine-phosphate adenylyltransferase [Nitrososphaerota archaeon]
MARKGRNVDWEILVETVHALPLYQAHKAYVRDRLLSQNPAITAEELSARLDIPMGEAMVILREVRMTGEEVLEELTHEANTPKRYLVASLGGTFEVLHVGHMLLFLTAFRNAESVICGLTSDEFAATLGKSHRVRPYTERMESLKSFLSERGWLGRCKIVRLEDPYGPTVEDPSIDLLVVSPSTLARAHVINVKRTERMLKPLQVIVTPLVVAEDGQPVSTSRILGGEVTAEGRLVRARP